MLIRFLLQVPSTPAGFVIIIIGIRPDPRLVRTIIGFIPQGGRISSKQRYRVIFVFYIQSPSAGIYRPIFNLINLIA